MQSLTSGERKTLVEGGSDARYSPTGHLVYTRGGSRMSPWPFDLGQLEDRRRAPCRLLKACEGPRR